MVKLTSGTKKIITVISMAIVGANALTTPFFIDLKAMLPPIITKALFGPISILSIAGIGTLVGVYWILDKQII